MSEIDLSTYTHWAYFISEESAQRCGAVFVAEGFVIRTEQIDPENSGTHRELWLLRAAKEMATDMRARHTRVRTVVEQHGGEYDGGSTGGLDF